MKAIVCTSYGPPDVLQIQEVEQPTPRDNEVLIKILATAVTASDCIIRGMALPLWHPIGFMMGLVVGFNRPRNPILGLVLAGEIASTGRDVKRFRVGDQVFGFTGTRFGSYAEYTCLPEKRVEGTLATIPGVIAPKPSNLTYEEAASLPFGGLLALHFLRKGKIQSRQKVLVYGASGAIGTSAIQLARYFGAEVTGVCSTANIEMVKSLGAERVIDYTRENITNREAHYDLILDAVGKSKSSNFKTQCKQALTPTGKYVSVDQGSPKPDTEDLILLKELVEAGQFKPVIDSCYPLEQIVEAHRYVDKGHKKGNIVITVRHDDKS
jgi:NADPH:quinone reductase-like Zn-dependent oxidoreductase